MKIVRQAQAFASTLNGSDKIYHNIQEVIYNEIHHGGLPMGSDLCPTKALTLFHLETDMPMLGLRPKWMRKRPKTMDHWGSSYLIMVKPQWMVSGLWLGCFSPLYGYNQITASYRRQNTPLNKEMMNIRCAIVAHIGHRLKTSKSERPPWSFMQEGHDRIS